MKKTLSFLAYILFCVFFYSFSSTQTNELEVYLKVKEQKIPISITLDSNLSNQDHSDYFSLLKQVLISDLEFSDKFNFVSPNFSFESVSTESFLFEPWESRNVHYVISLKGDYPKLTAYLIEVSSRTIQKFSTLSLQKNLNVDREKIHLLADTIYQKITGSPGIASSYILYSLKKSSLYSEKENCSLILTSYDGFNSKVIIQEKFLSVTPEFIPPSSQLESSSSCLYVSYKTGIPKIYLKNFYDKEEKKLISLRGNQLMPTINQQLNKIAFISDVKGNPDLFLQEFCPTKGCLDKPKQILSRFGAQGNPSFSPEGDKIVFVSNYDGSPRLYILSLKKIPGRPFLISKRNRNNTCPRWSPDGTKIAFSALTKGVRQIWVYDLITKEETQLTFSSDHKESPSWAPNNDFLVFSSKLNNSESNLFIINLRTKKSTQITKGEGEKRFPSWGKN